MMPDPQPVVAPTMPGLRVLLLNWRDTGHPEGGGSEVYAEELADGLARRGHEVTLLTAHYPGSRADETRPSGVRVLRRGGRHTVYPKAALAALRGEVGRPDVVIETQNGVPYLAALWTGRTTHVVLVHHVHREQWPVVFSQPVARAGWWLESRLAPWVNRRRPYVAVSEVTRRELSEQGIDPARIAVIHNGTIPPPPHDVVRSPEPLLLCMGRLVPHKRVELAVRTLDALRDEHPTARLVIAGRGWWEPRVREEVARLGLDDRVDVVGYVSERERHRLYARAWVSLLPSVKEGWGLVVVEAGRHATPTIAFDGTGGITESIRDGVTGLLARHDDLDHFVALTDRLLRDPVERARLGAAAEDFARGFTWEETVGQFAELVEAAHGRRRWQPGRGPLAVLGTGLLRP